MKNPFRTIRTTATVTLAVFVLCGASKVNPTLAGESNPTGVEVSIENFSFGSAALTVPVGTTVTWINKDDVPHTVMSTEKVFGSSVLDTDDKFSYTFTKPGTFPYFCSVHPKMTAKVVVK
jgi:plastocyanin